MPPKSKQRLALATYVRLMRAANAARNDAARHLGDTGLTLTQFAVLEALYHLGPMSLSDIAQKILTTGGNLTMVVGNLEKCGLAHRQKCSRRPPRADRRAVRQGEDAHSQALSGTRRRHHRIHGRSVSRRTGAIGRPLPQTQHAGTTVILSKATPGPTLVEGPHRHKSCLLNLSLTLKHLMI